MPHRTHLPLRPYAWPQPSARATQARWALALLSAAPLALLPALPTWAQDRLPGPDATGAVTYSTAPAGASATMGRDLPGRVGRIANASGRAWIRDEAHAEWVQAERNRPVTSGDRLSTDAGGRLHLQIGSSDIRLDQRTEIEFVRLDDEQILLHLHRGSLALHLRGVQQVGEVTVRTPEALVRPEGVGHLRVDRAGQATQVSMWDGQLRIDTPDRVMHTLVAGQRMVLDERSLGASPPIAGNFSDTFSQWVLRDARSDGYAGLPANAVSPEMTGVDDLARHGRWTVTQEYGAVWYPTGVASDWAPYRDGRWVQDPVWGWTWVDAAPWGFAPFHYGRWTQWGGRWAWVPGAYVDRPVYAPALVAWSGTGGSGVSVSVGVGLGAGWVGWMPLGPYDAYVPWYGYGPSYYQRINRPIPRQHVPQVPTGPIMYDRSRGTAAGVTVVPAQALRQPQSVREMRVQWTPARERGGEMRFSSAAPSFGAVPLASPGQARDLRREGEREGRGWNSPGARSGVVPVPGGGVPGAAVAPGFGGGGADRRPTPRGEIVDLRREQSGSRGGTAVGEPATRARVFEAAPVRPVEAAPARHVDVAPARPIEAAPVRPAELPRERAMPMRPAPVPAQPPAVMHAPPAPIPMERAAPQPMPVERVAPSARMPAPVERERAAPEVRMPAPAPAAPGGREGFGGSRGFGGAGDSPRVREVR